MKNFDQYPGIKKEYILVNKLLASLHVKMLRKRMPQFTPLSYTIV